MNETQEELVSVRKTRAEAREHSLGRKNLLFWVFSEIRLNCPPLRLEVGAWAGASWVCETIYSPLHNKVSGQVRDNCLGLQVVAVLCGGNVNLQQRQNEISEVVRFAPLPPPHTLHQRICLLDPLLNLAGVERREEAELIWISGHQLFIPQGPPVGNH